MTVLEEGMRAYLAEIDRRLKPMSGSASVHDRRLRAEQLAEAMKMAEPPGIVSQNWYIPLTGRELPVRIYRHRQGGSRPLVMFFHGGGWVTGSLDSHHYLAGALAAGADCVVVSVHYRRPPENPFPAPLDDCLEGIRWAIANEVFLEADTSRFAVAGDSAGGYLAAACALRARQSGHLLPAFQLLFYPMVEPNFDRPSYDEFADGPMLTRQDAMFYWQAMIGEDLSFPDPAADLARASLEGLPPAYVLTAEVDPLRDEGETFAERLRAAGVSVTSRRAPGVPHGFLRAGEFSEVARSEMANACAVLSDRLRASSSR